MRTRLCDILLLLLLPVLPAVLRAAPGDLDSGFGGDGKVVLAGLPGGANVAALLPDGRILVGGDFGIARLFQDGSRDADFGENGRVIVRLTTNRTESVNALALLPNGKFIVSVGSALFRSTADGQLDDTFGSNGIVTLQASSNRNDTVSALALEPVGKFLAAGISSVPFNGGVSFLLTRWNAVGSPDVLFGNGGETTLDFGGQLNVVHALVIQADGKIIVAGGTLLQHSLKFALARYTTSGALDTSFGTGGMVATALDGATFSQVNGLVLQPDGKIIAAGIVNGTNNADFALARYETDGSLDPSFGEQGFVRTDFAEGSRDVLYAVGLQEDGKIVAAGSSGPSVFKQKFVLARYQSDGSLDGSFGSGGWVSTQFDESHADEAYDLALLSDGRILLAGKSGSDDANTVALARYHAADLGVLQSVTPEVGSVGDHVTHRFQVQNDRVEAVTGVRLIDKLPSSLQFVSAHSTQGSCSNDGDTVICNLGSIASESPASVTIVSSIKTTAHLCNTALVEANETDSHLTNSATACVAIDPATEAPQNLAVTEIRAPKKVMLDAGNPEQTELVIVQIQNRSPHPETITNLEGVVSLAIHSLTNNCPGPIPVLLTGSPQPSLPVTLPIKAKLDVYFAVSFSTNCVPDPLASSRESHDDYRYEATVSHAAVDDNSDTFPLDDDCPRNPLGTAPVGDALIKDKGCGGKKKFGGFGAPVVTDVIVR